MEASLALFEMILHLVSLSSTATTRLTFCVNNDGI